MTVNIGPICIGSARNTSSRDERFFVPFSRLGAREDVTRLIGDQTLDSSFRSQATIWSYEQYSNVCRLHVTAGYEQDIVMSRTAGDVYWYDEYERPLDRFLAYPMGHIFVSTWLAQEQLGVPFHSAASADERGILFAGASGAGKSTLSAVLETCAPKLTMVTDERSIVFSREGLLCVSGTPWHGSANIARAGDAHLAQVLLLEHSRENRLTPMGKTEAATELFRCSFPTFWYRPGMEFALEFCIRVASEIPCMRFGFRPDESAVRFLEREIGL